MANAKLDNNGVPSTLGTLQSDGVTPVVIKINPANNAMKVVDGTTGTASTRTTDLHDNNGKKAWMGVSSSDFKTPVLIAADSSGNLLIQTT